MSELAWAGSLEDVSFPELLVHLYSGACTGTLTLRRDDVVKNVHFQDGRLVFARSTDREDRLGEFLLRRGVISLRQYVASASRIEPGKRQGAILCEMGAISADELVRYVTDQVSEILYSLFHWSRGSYEIERGESDAQERVVLAISIEEIILNGIRRMNSWERIWSGLGESIHTVFAPSGGGHSLSYRASLTDDEAHVLSLVNGKLEVGRILEGSYTSNFETCRMLWALRVIGAIAPVSEASAQGADSEDYALAEMVESYDRLLSFVHAFVTERIGDLVDHFVDRAIAIARGAHGAALADVHLRNQGRVEYEQLYANLAARSTDERHRMAEVALGDLVAVLVGLAGRELGPEEESLLVDELLGLAREVPGLPIEDVLAAERREKALRS